MAKKLLFLALLFLVSIPAFAQVDTAWVRRYNGPGNDYDGAWALAVDDSGNVYVTGYSYNGVVTYSDYTTIKYYPNGDTAWVRSYNGPGDSWDYAEAIAVDDSGNVYVTGKSWGSGTDFDYATIKYYPDGDTAWVRRYNGPANDGDAASAIKVDDSGKVYVTGSSAGSGTYHDYATIKYSSNGDTVWVRRYNGPVDDDDYAQAIKVDNSGKVYVTGYSEGSGTNYDYATIMYNPNGDTVWVRRYNGLGNLGDYAHDVALDESGNVYVTGSSWGSGTLNDYTTIKYYSTGDTAWVRRYDAPENYDDHATAIAVDGTGNVYVTGDSYDSGTYYDYLTIKYNPNGDTAWARRYNGPGNYDDWAVGIAVDGSGDVYVTGYSNGSGTYWDYATIKYYPNGDTGWVRRYNGPANDVDVPFSIALDHSNNVYVTGYSWASDTYEDIVTIKYVQLPTYLCGDVNDDGEINLSDPICLANYYFGKPCDINAQASDVNCDTLANLGDALIIANVYFGKPGFVLDCCD